VTLGEKGVKTLDDFADLAGDELLEILATSDKGGVTLELDEANAMIMAVREQLGWFEEAAPAAKE
jgi:N utilization substance protein A